jgi:hypothetical protein
MPPLYHSKLQIQKRLIWTKRATTGILKFAPKSLLLLEKGWIFRRKVSNSGVLDSRGLSGGREIIPQAECLGAIEVTDKRSSAAGPRTQEGRIIPMLTDSNLQLSLGHRLVRFEDNYGRVNETVNEAK